MLPRQDRSDPEGRPVDLVIQVANQFLNAGLEPAVAGPVRARKINFLTEILSDDSGFSVRLNNQPKNRNHRHETKPY